MKIAFFDIGTNSIHMKIVKFYDDLCFEVLEHEKDMTRLGDGSFDSQELSKPSMKRALKILGRFTADARKNGVTQCVAVATSAVREAQNRFEFIRLVKRKTGLSIRVITGQEEARLIFLGAASGLDVGRERTLVVDIGGGSMELVLGNNQKIDFADSFPLGVARLKDFFISGYPPKKKEIKRLRIFISDILVSSVKAIRNRSYGQVIGTGGTLINLASIIYEKEESRRLRLRGHFEIKKNKLCALTRKLTTLSLKKVKKIPGLDSNRADLIVPGVVLVDSLYGLFKKNGLMVSDKGIREGLILDFMMKRFLKLTKPKPSLKVQWFGQKPFFSGRIIRK